MTFVEAAVELLGREGASMSLEILVERALAEGLISADTRNPLSTMKGRLTTEIKKGLGSRIIEVAAGVFALAPAVNGAGSLGEEVVTPIEEDLDIDVDMDDDDDDEDQDDEDDDQDDEDDEDDDEDGDEDDDEDEDDDDEDDDEDDDDDDDDDEDDEDDDDDDDDDDVDDDEYGELDDVEADDALDDALDDAEFDEDEEEDKDDDEEQDLRDLDTEALAAESGDEDDDDEDEDEDGEQGETRRPLAPETDEEVELAEIYEGEDETVSAADRNEYSDEQTPDEDRPMLPAIRAERGRSRGRRERGGPRERGGARERSGGRGRRRRPGSRPSDERTSREVGAEATLGDQIVDVLSSVGDRSMGARQVAQALRKHYDHGESTDELTALVRRTVLAQRSQMVRHQLRPRLEFRSGGRVAQSGYRESPQLVAALTHLEQEAEVALAHKLGQLSQAKLEALSEVWLTHAGFRDLVWVKRVQSSSYATAIPAEQVEPILVSVRGGGKPVDRRGIGELRAGVVAKNLVSGLLIAPQPLSPEALTELAKEGPPTATLCGPTLTRALCDAGLGVSTRTFTVRSLDEGFFESL